MDNPIPPDRVSELPDHLLLKILSRIPIEEAVKTLILSKRWQHLWTYLDHLDFISKEMASKRKLYRFVSFVDNVLRLSRCSKIKNFFLTMDYYPQFSHRISAWVRWAVEKHVEELILDLQPGMRYAINPFYVIQPFYELPQNICTCPSLVTMDIGRCKFSESSLVSWKFLTRLTLNNIVLDDGLLAKLLYAFPLLESLELISFNGFNNLSVVNPNLKRLMLFGYWFPVGDHLRDNVLKISAPYIQELEIVGRIYDLQCRLVDVSSLVLADLDFELSYSREFDNDDFDICLKVGRDLIKSVAHVKKLTLGTWMLEVLTLLGRQLFSYSLSNCKSLTLNAYLTTFEFPAVVDLLDNSPHLETLVIDVDTDVKSFFDRDKREPSELECENFLNLQYPIIKCLTLSLKNVKIENYLRCCTKDEILLQWGGRWSDDKLPITKYDLVDILSEEELVTTHFLDQDRLRLKKLAADKETFKKLIFIQDIGCMFAEFLLKNSEFLEKFVIVSERKVCDRCSTCCDFEYLSIVFEKLLTLPKASTGAVFKFVEKQSFYKT